MYSNKTRSDYQARIHRRRFISFAIILLVAVVVLTGAIHFADKFKEKAGIDHKELLQLWDSGNYDEVFRLSGDALVSRPVDYFLLTMHGFSAYQMGISQINSLDSARYFDDCIQSLRKALLLKNAANDGRLHYVLGKAYSYKGESYADLAVKFLENARGLSYKAADIPEYLGLAYAATGDYRNSVAAFSEALGTQVTRPNGRLFFSIAESYFALGEFDTARAYLQRCIDISPDSQTVLSAKLLLAETRKNVGDIDGAVSQLIEVVEEAEGNAEAHYRLGELYALQGDVTRARAEWRLTLRVDPAHVKARTRLSM
jgi:tetratricopeptide (TPR) repeat protein